MDFELNEEQKLVKQNARSFMEREIIPVVNTYEKMTHLPNQAAHELLKTIIPLGYLNGPFPKECGGMALDWTSYAVLYEELARAWGSLAGIVQIQIAGAHYLAAPGAEDQRWHLAALFAGDKIWCEAGTEPEAGSNLAECKTIAALDNDYYVINGTKTWISCAFIAEMAIVLALMDPSKGSRGMSLIIIDKEVSPFATRLLPKIGMRCWDNAELTFEDCWVHRKNIIGEPGSGFRRFMAGVELSRCCISMNSLGAAQAALDSAIDYAKQRRQFGKVIGQFQLIQGMLADMWADVEAARFLVYRAFQSLDQEEGRARNVALAKSFAPRVAVRVTSEAMEVLGAYGLSEEYQLERYFRDARVAVVPDGTTQMQQLIVGRDLLGISAFA